MTEATLTLISGADGIFEVRTVTGTRYVFELSPEGDFITRKPGMSHPEAGNASVRLPGDFTCLPLLSRPTLIVGEPFHFEATLEDATIVRESSPVTGIAQL